MVRILFLNGGSGGHFYPMLAVIEAAQEIAGQRGIDFEPIILSPNSVGRAEAVERGLKFIVVPSGKLRRYSSWKNIIDPGRTVINLLASLGLVWWWLPDATFGNGGYGSLPAGMVSWLYRIPLFIHESDARLGLANKILYRLASRTSQAFEAEVSGGRSKAEKHVVGNPIRRSLLKGDAERARKRFGIISYKPILLVLGGSQGAQEINRAVTAVRSRLLERFEIIHQAGELNLSRMRDQDPVQSGPEYHLVGFLNDQDLADAYQLAALVIARAGASTIFELAALGKPSVLVPLRGAAGGHQRLNAYNYARHGATLVVEEPNTSPHVLAEQVFALADDDSLLKKMSQRALNFARPEAAQRIAEGLLEMAGDE